MSGAQGQGGRPLAVGCECQSATCQREGSHEHLPALQEELQHRDHWRSKRERSVRAKDVQSAVVQLPAHRMRGFLGRRNRPHCSSHRNRGAGHRRAPGSETEVVRQHPHAPGSPLPRQVAACPLQGAVPVAVLSDSPWPRTRFNRSISATSATWARVSAPCGLKSFSACSTTWAEIALPSASATTLNAIHPRWMVLLSSRCTAGPLLAARGEQIGTLLSSPPAPGVGNRLVLVSAGQRLPGKAEKTGELGICLDAEGGLCFSQGRIHGVSKSLVTAGSQP